MDGGNSPCPVLKPAYFPTRSVQSVRPFPKRKPKKIKKDNAKE